MPHLADESGSSSGLDIVPAPARSPLRRRRRAVLGVVASAGLLAVGGLVGATFIKSPAQLAAEQQPPKPTLLTAEVVRQVVSDTLILRGTVQATQEFPVTPTSGIDTANAPIVTAVHKSAGDEVVAGDVIVEVSGRPLIALQGATPAFRDLRPGGQGADVRALQEALAALGFPSRPDTPGVFGAGTKKAVRGLYGKLGFDAPATGGPDGQDESALQGARDAVTQAERHLRDVREAGATVGPHAVEDATADLRVAKQRLADLEASIGEMVPRSEIVFLPSFPARVSKLNARVGGEVQPPLVTLSAGTLEVVGRLDPADRALVRPDVVAEIDSESTGVRATGRVIAIGDATDDSRAAAPSTQPGLDPGTEPASAHVPVRVAPDTPLDPQLLGQDVRLTLRFAQTTAPVLAVPQAAISSSADGRTYVTKIGPNDARTRVAIRPGVSGNGLVEVTPVSGELAEGDTVVTGS